MKRTSALIALTAAGALIAGCGGSGETAQDRYNEALFQVEAGGIVLPRLQYCAAVEQADPDLVHERHPAVSEALDTLIRVAREDPDRTYETERDGVRTMRQVLADEVTAFTGCDGELRDRAQRALDTL